MLEIYSILRELGQFIIEWNATNIFVILMFSIHGQNNKLTRVCLYGEEEKKKIQKRIQTSRCSYNKIKLASIEND